MSAVRELAGCLCFDYDPLNVDGATIDHGDLGCASRSSNEVVSRVPPALPRGVAPRGTLIKDRCGRKTDGIPNP